MNKNNMFTYNQPLQNISPKTDNFEFDFSMCHGPYCFC